MNRVQSLVGPVLVVFGALPRAQSDTGAELGARIEAIRAEAEVPALGAALPTPRYALGWGVERRDWAGGDGVALEHNGSNTLWYCVAWLAPADGFAVLVTANQATPTAKGATKEAAELLVAEHARRARGGGR